MTALRTGQDARSPVPTADTRRLHAVRYKQAVDKYLILLNLPVLLSYLFDREDNGMNNAFKECGYSGCPEQFHAAKNFS
ncbi:MAG: hypothetical protein O8C59_01835 [Candidatus Methanoperedens sp.]|nr:hypothetical protein [Candidatus Methanoperedens sp.]